MWHCVISGEVITCKLTSNCFKFYNLWYALRFACCYWEKISKFNVFIFCPFSTVSVSDNFSSPHGDSRWGRGKWLEVIVHGVSILRISKKIDHIIMAQRCMFKYNENLSFSKETWEYFGVFNKELCCSVKGTFVFSFLGSSITVVFHL